MPDHEASESQPRWSPEVRSWVSLLLFVHLFAVVVAMTSYTRPSGLQEKLHALFAPYLRNLHLTAVPASYPFARFHLTHNTSSDVDFSCEIDSAGPAGTSEKSILPQPGLWPAVRWRRYQNLANATGALASDEANDEFGSILPRAIAGSVLKRGGASQGTFRCRAHYLPEIDEMDDVVADNRGPLEKYATTYEAQVFISSSGVELLKKSTTLEVAPVESAPKTRSSPTP